MKVLKTLPYVVLIATFLLTIPLVLGFSKEAKTFGISGIVTFENVSAKGALIVFTTTDENPFETGFKDATYIEQYLQKSGYFYRELNEFGGEDINVWIRQEGYPIIQVYKVLDTNDDQIRFGTINIPAKLQSANKTPVEFFKAPCEKEPIVTIVPSKIQTVRNFRAVKCSENNTIQFKAQIDLLENTQEAKDNNPNPAPLTRNLAVVVF